MEWEVVNSKFVRRYDKIKAKTRDWLVKISEILIFDRKTPVETDIDIEDGINTKIFGNTEKLEANSNSNRTLNKTCESRRRRAAIRGQGVWGFVQCEFGQCGLGNV